MNTETQRKKKSFKLPNYCYDFCIILLCAIKHRLLLFNIMVLKILNAIDLLRKRQKFNSQQEMMSKPVHLWIKPLHLTIRKYFFWFRLIAGFL